MILPILVAAMMLVEAPAPAAPVAPAPAAPAPVAAPLSPIGVPPATPQVVPVETPSLDPITAIDRLMETYKGKSGDPLRGKLGLSYTIRAAKDGEVVYWRTRADSMGCGIGADGVMRCGSVADWECQLAVAFDKAGKVTFWKATGAPEACVNFAVKLQPDK